MSNKPENNLMEKLNNREFLGGVVMFVMFGAIKALSMKLPAKVSTYPIFMSNVGLVLAVLLFIRCLYRLKKGTLEPEKAFLKDGETRTKYFLSMILLVAYAVLFKFAGCILSTLVFIFLFSTLFAQKRDIRLNLIVSVVFTAVIYLGFGVFLGVPLPTLFL